LLVAETLRSILEQLPVLDVAAAHGEAQLRPAMMLLSYFSHGYVWGGKKAVDQVPSGVAVPWHTSSIVHRSCPTLRMGSTTGTGWTPTGQSR